METSTQTDAGSRLARLEKENAELQERLEFVEELLGPTEAQRKAMQEQVLAARSAAVRAKYNGAGVPVKVVGRLDEGLISAVGLSEHEVGLLQGGCVMNTQGIMQDVSMLGDPRFRPYDSQTGNAKWDARGGALQLSLGDVKDRFGGEIAQEVLRCAQDLDKYDASRRIGIELPWHPKEHRELEPAEVIDLLDREVGLQSGLLCGGTAGDGRLAAEQRDSGNVGFGNIAATGGLLAAATAASVAAASESRREYHGAAGHADIPHLEYLSPYAVVNVLPRRGVGNPTRRPRRSGRNSMRGRSASSAARGRTPVDSVVPLPRVDAARRAQRFRIHDSFDVSVLGCAGRSRFF
eukprot:TRINITY_DN37261_c0_g1_i1.p1 TRINITY_DN37261_c0_g1~~TRINITY_DN37261_c0_g1_i1.p1  ORF type:complete len:350 (+),score=47.42 TRINITY_DN37261_c0_g1_i1:180-1229(+)